MLVHRVCRAWKERGSIGLMRHVVRRVMPVHTSLVYAKNEESGSCVVPGLVIERHRLPSDVNSTTIDILRASRDDGLVREVDKLFARGCELWLGWIEGEIAGFCWSQGNKIRNDYFVHLDKDDATILSCFVFPQYRGRGIYPTMLEEIVRTLINYDQVSNIYIDCKSWNLPSIRGIQKAGFNLLGSAVRIVLCRRVWILRNRCRRTQ